MNKIIIVDYGMGNLRSVAQAFRHAAPSAEIIISADSHVIAQGDRIVLPGQGAMPDCMRNLQAAGLQEVIMQAARTKPLFGVCIGEQMLFDASAESATAQPTPGLALIPGKVVRFQLEGRLQADGSRFKVPQMGWNQVHQQRAHPLWKNIPDAAYFYFVHSFFACPARADDIAATTEYGDVFACAVAHANIFATQFHPEKSAAAGLQLYQNFSNWNP